jgi:hypothetical protein
LNFPISRIEPIINKAPALREVACIHNPHFLQGNTPIGSWVGASVSYWGDCFPSCLRNAYIEDEALDIEEVVKDENSINIYNNSIEIFDITEYSHYQIFDIMGRQVENAKVNKNIISTEGIPHGTYFISFIKTNGEVEHHKFMRQ